MRLLIGLLTALFVAALSTPLAAQAAGDPDTSTIAGVLGGPNASDAWWTFKSSGREVLFARLDAQIYVAREHSDHGDHVAVLAEEGGCSGEEGGPARFCLQVIAPAGAILCEATRPAPPPGWQRDPRLACLLPAAAVQVTYRLRVSLTGPEGTCLPAGSTVAAPQALPFLLDVSVRGLPASGLGLHQAAGQSKNRF